MPNQSPQTADTKPKARKSAAARKEDTQGVSTPKAPAKPKSVKTKVAPASSGSDAPPKATRKRTPKTSTGAGEDSTVPTMHKAPAEIVTQDSVPAHEVILEESDLLTEVTYEMIAVRAYFLAENRQANGGHGDPAGDWHEAERQLRAEAAAIATSLKHKH